MKPWLLAAALVVLYVIAYGDIHRKWFNDPETKDRHVSWFWLGWFLVCLAETVAALIVYAVLF